MALEKKIPLGIVSISVIMFFAALATDIFWLGRWTASAFPGTMPVPPKVYNAFGAPDVILSLLLYIGAVGLIKLKKYGFVAALVAMGMWLFDSLLVLGITGRTRVGIVGPSLLFVVFAVIYLWNKRGLYS
jgi:hypothetical protein